MAATTLGLVQARYRLATVPLLLMAVGGAVLATLGDAAPGGAGSAPLAGDLLTLVVALLASIYMVLFKLVFPSMTTQEFLFFFMVKSGVTMGVGWIGILAFWALGWETPSWPRGCAVLWLPLSAAASAAFNWSLNWGTLRISPLTARLSLLLGIPCSFVVDVALGKPKGIMSWLGVVFVLCGVVAFEIVSSQHRRPISDDDAATPLPVVQNHAQTADGESCQAHDFALNS